MGVSGACGERPAGQGGQRDRFRQFQEKQIFADYFLVGTIRALNAVTTQSTSCCR
jgi:hypothetical protein